jgi:indole-3-glycerol phosphate synthase
MKELQNKLNKLTKLGYSTIALDITNLDKTELERLISRSIYEETKYLIWIAEKGIAKSHQVETLKDEIIDFIIKLI